MTVDEVYEAMRKYKERGLGNLPVGYNIETKFGFTFQMFNQMLRIVDDYDGEVILLGPEIRELKKVKGQEDKIKDRK